MLLQLFSGDLGILGILTWIAALLIAISIHEAAHAWTADRLGDPTARLMGRLTLNPKAHLDLIGTIMLLFVGFGWGKPVPFDPYNLADPRKDSALISLSGPLSNIIAAFLLGIPLRLGLLFNIPELLSLGTILQPIIFLNITLAVFNLLPIAPLDGFKIFGGILPKELAGFWYSLESMGLFILVFLLLPFGGGSILFNLINPLRNLLLSLMY